MILWEETEIDGIFAEVHPDPDIKGNDTLRGDGNSSVTIIILSSLLS